jgi:hypothetical protein
MPKTINWPLSCYEAITTATPESEVLALRLGTLYYDNRYWNPGDVVDVRVNHEIMRQAEISREMRSCRIEELDEADWALLPFPCQSSADVVAFLRQTYPEKHAEEPIAEASIVSVVYCRYLEMAPVA